MICQPFPLIDVEGPAYERGYQHGVQARERIARGIEAHCRSIQHFSALDWGTVVDRAAAYLPHIQSFAPAMVEELRGIAIGAGRAFADILALNVRWELTFTPKMIEGCTSFAVLPEATADGHTYVGQTWDNLAALTEGCIILRVSAPDGPSYVTMTEPGVPAMVGLNANGIAFARNALLVAGMSEPAVPVSAVHYRLARCQTVGDAVSAVLAPRLAASLAAVVGAVGDAIALEATPGGADFIHDEGGLVVHANHLNSSRLPVTDLGKVAFPDSLFRDRRLYRYLAARRGHLDVATVFAGLRDHFNYPDSICRHPDERDAEAGRMCTVSAVVMDLDTRTMYVTAGPPCRNDYRAVSLSQHEGQTGLTSPPL